MSHWPGLTKTALLGTQREPLPDSQNSGGPLGQLLHQTQAETKEITLLLHAGILATYEANGRIPEQIHVDHPPAPEAETRPVAPPYVTQYLDAVMYGQYVNLFQIYLEAINKAGYRLPRQVLPNLLDKGFKSVKIRPYLLPVLGHEGRWLASHNPVWDYASPDIYTWTGLTRYWTQNQAIKRQQLLTDLRSSKPDLARKLLENYWRNCPDMARHQLIKILETNISMADEPFLEAALADRNHLVRRKAVELLTFLPQSRLSQRMKGYANKYY